jgi:hypothetical protein
MSRLYRVAPPEKREKMEMVPSGEQLEKPMRRNLVMTMG